MYHIGSICTDLKTYRIQNGDQQRPVANSKGNQHFINGITYQMQENYCIAPQL